MLKIWHKRKTEQIKEKTSEEKLNDFFNNFAKDPSLFVHLAIDVQKYSSSGEINNRIISRHIGCTIAPTFNELSIPTYWIYYRDWSERSMDEEFCQLGPFEAYGGLHDSIKPSVNDKFIRKHRDSAFLGSNIHDILQKEHKKVLLVSGFNYDSCVLDTMIDAREHDYHVLLLKDATNHNNLWERPTREMKKHGIAEALSSDVCHLLKNSL